MHKGGTETGRALNGQVRPTPKRALDKGRGAAVETRRAARNWARGKAVLVAYVARTLESALGLNGQRCGAAFKTGRISSNHAVNQSPTHLPPFQFRRMKLSHLISEADTAQSQTS